MSFWSLFFKNRSTENENVGLVKYGLGLTLSGGRELLLEPQYLFQYIRRMMIL